ncbi:zinc ribbon domain-containing protein [Tissierella carlieri]|uniref:zinc ribbon domain-containing protein n=1 Tax=Tissierella carlieri TaxID=689904 RepID=UPI001C0FC345|nr:zinc ribbon domain-containing protein [Tissierella carlieri]MBU5311916.1 zinc ribbon domain-containing protein [Tissierella carlieri]
MALISCPECTKEISDKVKACPHCGYPLVEDNIETQKVELTSVNVKIEEGKKKKIVGRLISFLIIISMLIGGIWLYNQEKEKKKIEEYTYNVDELIKIMHASVSKAEELLNLTYKVWYNTIYEESDSETDKYTQIDEEWVDDFNVAIERLYFDNEIDSEVKSMEYAQKRIEKDVKELKNIPDEYERSYETILELYNVYQKVIDLARNPKGNLKSFGESKDEIIDKYIDIYRRLETQLP